MCFESLGLESQVQTWTLHSFCIFRGHRPPDCTLVSRLLTPPPQGLLHAPQSAHSPHVPVGMVLQSLKSHHHWATEPADPYCAAPSSVASAPYVSDMPWQVQPHARQPEAGAL